MAVYERGDAAIHFDDEGAGFPVLLLAPGGMRSANDRWLGMPWNPREALVDRHRVIGMDQRNAGRSTAPIRPDDDWSTYTADQLGLLDHLGIERCHVVGMCIGGPYVLGLLAAAPERFAAAVLLQPVGIDGNREAFVEMFEQWRADIAADHPEADDATWDAFRSNMWDGEFVLTVGEAEIAACATPMLVAMGNDLYHPSATSRRIVELAPNARLVERWKEGDALAAIDVSIRELLAAHDA